MATGAELGYNTGASALVMANTIFGDGSVVVAASYTGDARSKAVYSNGAALSPGAVPGDTGVILSTGRADSFTQSSGDPNRSESTSLNTTGPNGVAGFNALAGTGTFDAAYLDVDFIPTGNFLTMKLVFSSEEYPFAAGSSFNDVVGVWVNGSPVPVSVGDGTISVNNINQTTNSALHQSNTADTYNTEMDGLTVTLSLTIPVNAGMLNSLRVGVADAGDASYDSNVMIAADSVTTTLVPLADAATVQSNGATTVNVLGNDVNTTGGTLTITHINGQAVSAGSTVTLASGQTVTLNANGTLTFQADADLGPTSFTYTVASSTGPTGIGMVTVDTVPCFVAGTMIRTPAGERRVESLRPGDVVLTQDDGPQPLRWIGTRRVQAEGAYAPVRIKAGTFGRHRTLLVSPQHRVLVSDYRAELLFGEAEVLVAAIDLVDGRDVDLRPGGEVTYVHLLFDRHQMVWSSGLLTESFLPGPMVSRLFDAAVLGEICELFPELDPDTGAGYGAAARRALRGYEASVLLHGAAA